MLLLTLPRRKMISTQMMLRRAELKSIRSQNFFFVSPGAGRFVTEKIFRFLDSIDKFIFSLCELRENHAILNTLSKFALGYTK